MLKYFLIFLAQVALAMTLSVKVVQDDSHSLPSHAADIIEAFKQKMPCGIHKLGIPPLAPLEIAHKQLDISAPYFRAVGLIDKFRLDGLDNFDIVEMKNNALLSKVTFKFNWNYIQFQTDYKLATSRDNYQGQISGNGKLALQNFTVWADMQYSLDVVSGNVRIKSLNFKMSLDNVISEIDGLASCANINTLVNSRIEEWLILAIKFNYENYLYYAGGYVMHWANDRIGDMTLSDLLALIGEGGEEKIPCMPEKIKDG